MKRFIFTAISLATVLSFSGCDPKVKARRDRPAPGPQPTEETGPKTRRDDSGMDTGHVEKKEHNEVVEPAPVKRNTVPPPPEPKSNNPEYAIKADGKPGYVKSPYDSQNRLIDVRGLPPGTEAECPYTRRTFLVPP